MARESRIETRQLSTGNWIALDRDERTLYLFAEDASPSEETTRDNLRGLAARGAVFALDREALVSLYDEFTRIAVLG